MLAHIDRHEEPLLGKPPRVDRILYAVDTNEDYQLCFGHPFDGPPEITWRKFITEYIERDVDQITEYELYDEYGIEPTDLDRTCDSPFYPDVWCRSGSPNSQAYYCLWDLDIGPELVKDGEVVGHLEFLDGPMMASD